LFTEHALHAGVVVARLGGTPVDNQALADLQPHSSLSIGEGTSLVQGADDPAQFMNHSCDSGCWMADEVTVVTRRSIGAGEEVTLDYALVSADPEWRMECQCGSDLCRGVVTGNDWKLPDVQERYRNHFSPFINQRVAALRASI
jgi:hypothetical protein